MNIAFFGTSNKSTPILEGLKNSEFNLKLCITKNHIKVGRKQKTKTTAVKDWANKNRVQVITIPNLNVESKDTVLKSLKDNNIDLIVVADFAYIVPEEIFNYPTYKTINIHFSLLPNYRGSSPVQFSILNGDKKTAISYVLMDKKLDAGPIIHQTTHKILNTDTTGSLYKRLFEIAGTDIADVIKNYVDGKYKPKKQNKNKATYTYSPTHPKSTLIYKEDAKIDWLKSPKDIHNMIRAYYPWPIAWTTLKEFDKNYVKIKPNKDLSKKVKIYKSQIKNGRLKIEFLKIEGKKKISWNDFKNGYLK